MKGSRQQRIALALVAAIAIAGAALGVPFVTSSDSTAPAPEPGSQWSSYTATVQSGPFHVDLTLHARLEAGQSVTLSSALPSNTAKILELAADGSYLREGDLVARFDPRPLYEAVRKLDSEIRDVEAQLQQLHADSELMKNDGVERTAQLDYLVEVAATDREQAIAVELPAREARAARDYRTAVSNYEALRRKFTTQQSLLERGLSTQQELASAEAAKREAEADRTIALGELEGLREVTLPAERRHADLQLENARRERHAFTAALTQRLQKQSGSIRRVENKLANLQEELREAQHHLTLTELRAPVTGILLHRRVSAGLEKRKPQIGDSLWKGHAFAVVPDMSSMIAEAAVSEREVGKLAVGQRVRLVPDAYPDLLLAGSVDSIGTLVESDRGEPQFAIRIALQESDERLRPGMSGRASVRTATLPDALRVPVQAVFIEDLQPVGFIMRGDDVARVELALGPSDGRDVVITSGLARGERVLMVYPDSLP